jgi:hypothetical protein
VEVQAGTSAREEDNEDLDRDGGPRLWSDEAGSPCQRRHTAEVRHSVSLLCPPGEKGFPTEDSGKIQNALRRPEAKFRDENDELQVITERPRSRRGGA